MKQFLRKHTGCTAWIFGKGQSLDKYLKSIEYLQDAHQPTDIKFCVNEAALVVKNPHYFFAHDVLGIQRVMAPKLHILSEKVKSIDPRVRLEYPSGCHALVIKQHLELAAQLAPDPKLLHGYHKGQFATKLLSMTPEELVACESLYADSATIQSACHFAKLVGCVRVVLVGVDGGSGIAEVFNGARCPTGPWYTKNRHDTHRILNSIGMPFIVWGEDPWPVQ